MLSDGFEIETELSVHALELALPVMEIETPYYARPEGSFSKLNTWRDGFRILGTILKLYRSEKPLRFFTVIGIFLSLVSIGLAIPVIITFLEEGHRAAVADGGAVDGPDDRGGAFDILGAGAGYGDARPPRDEAVGLSVPAGRQQGLRQYRDCRFRRWTAPPPDAIPRSIMSELDVTILAETPKDAQAIERLHERTFGPGRFVLSAYRLREHVDHLLDLSFTARIGTLLVGSVRQLPICIGDTPALMLGPLTVEPPFRGRGVGRMLLERSLQDARAKGHRLVVLVGDEPYYSRVGFKIVPKGRAIMPGPVDYSRVLVAELVEGAFDAVSGDIRPDWSKAR